MRTIGPVSAIAFISIILAGFLGCILNIITLLSSYETLAQNEFIIRLIGVPIPIIGAVMGYM